MRKRISIIRRVLDRGRVRQYHILVRAVVTDMTFEEIMLASGTPRPGHLARYRRKWYLTYDDSGQGATGSFESRQEAVNWYMGGGR